LITDKAKLKDIIQAVAGREGFPVILVEKDYYLTIVLNAIGPILSDKLVFKGGTLLNKSILNYHRLSEDLDFTYLGKLETKAKRSQAMAAIKEKLPELLKAVRLTSDDPKGSGYNNSTQYVFNIQYQSLFSAARGTIKLEISLRQSPILPPVYKELRHLFKDPFTGEDLISRPSVLSLVTAEAVAEKLKAAVSRQDAAIRDFYDLAHIDASDFNFLDDDFIQLFKKKLFDEKYQGNFRVNFGLSEQALADLKRQINTDLIPVLRAGDSFDFGAVITRFNEIFNAPKFKD